MLSSLRFLTRVTFALVFVAALCATIAAQDKAAPAIDVARLAGNPARHPPQVLVARREEPERRPPEIEAIAERLALANADVDSLDTRRLQDSEG